MLRHERKLAINISDIIQLRHRLYYCAQPDENAGTDGKYKIRSLYFDNYRDLALTDKLMGAAHREKFRLRYYGNDLNLIRLEKKSKQSRMTQKDSAMLSKEMCEQILQNEMQVLRNGNELCEELYAKMQTQQLRPRTIVDYTREAFVYAPGNVRITIDTDIRMSAVPMDFLQPDSVTIPASASGVLEIKYDAFLPDIIRDALQLGTRRESEFSKYVAARLTTG